MNKDVSSEPTTIFVTGGAGYVGAHCCKRFSQAGYQVVVYDNLSRGWRDFVKWGPLIEGDILDQDRLASAMREVKPDVVAHFAALAYVGESVERPDLYYRNNVLGSLSVLDAMRENQIDQIVFSSTCATYGSPNELPIHEGHEQIPINPCGRSKLMVEQILKDYSEAYGIRSVALRYFNAAGADPDGEIGERHDPEPHLIPLALKGAGDETYTLKILGDDFETKDGSAVRDYIHVMDLAEAHLLAVEYLRKAGATTHCNLGTGQGISVKEIRDTVERVTGRKVNSQIAARRPGDPACLVAKTDRAKSVLGWEPRYSSIDQIIEDAWRWHLSELAR